MTDDDHVLSPAMRRAHVDVHAAVTAFLNGDETLAMSVITQCRQPLALATAAVRELTSAIETLAHATGADPQETWTEICAAWHLLLDTDTNPG